MLRAVILDLGNVLVLHDNARLFRAIAATASVPEAEVEEGFDHGLWTQINRGMFPGDGLRIEMMRRFRREIDDKAWFAAWNSHFTLNEPMIRSVERLVGRVRLVLLSNTHDQHFAYLRPQLSVLDHFAGAVLSCEQGVVKPERAIYEQALAIADTDPHETAYFDDVKAYVDAASNLGMHGRHFTSTDEFVGQLAALGLVL